jgi:UV DNA damage endonuclease
MLSENYLIKRKQCCGNGCLMCPYIPKHTKGSYKIMNRMGYACINTQLSNQKPRIYTGRGMIKRTFKSKGIKYASELGLQNTKDLFEIIKWNHENGFDFFRITSNLFPWCSEYKLEDMPDHWEIAGILGEIGKYVDENNMRITSHPGPFNVLTSPHEHVVENCIKDLSIHGEVFDMMGLSRTPYNKINIHIGGVYGDKKSAKDLFYGVYAVIGIPIVFDYHHHRFNDGGLTEEGALKVAISTWGDIKPVVHYSESRNIEQEDDKIRPQAHSDYVYDYIDTYGNKVDIMVEAKAKELAVLKYKELHG